MADTQTTVTNLDIQLLDADRSNATTVKLDNPKNNVTREQVSAAFQPALTNGWFLCSNGNTAMYLGDITVNQSIKTKLGGEDFYVTPSSISGNFTGRSFQTEITVSGATIQGYNFANIDNQTGKNVIRQLQITENQLSAILFVDANEAVTSGSYSMDLQLIILGTTVTIPVTIAPQQ